VKSGDPFDPQDVIRRLKVYPVDVVDARTDISDGPKRLYAKLFRIVAFADRKKHEWHGYVYASEQYLAVQLGKSIAGVRRDLATLRTLGLIRVDRPNRRANNHYFFLWRPEFDRPNGNSQASDERLNLSDQSRPNSANLSGRDSADVSGPYMEEPEALTHTEPARERFLGRGEESDPAKSRVVRGVIPMHLPLMKWPMGGWQSREDFDAWWADLVQGHPNRHHSSAAKVKALELIRSGQLDRAQFDGGYAALRAANADRWSEQNGRYTPNLLSILEDCLWKFTPRPAAVSEYEDSETYLRRVANE
jgi:hypothetical protein